MPCRDRPPRAPGAAVDPQPQRHHRQVPRHRGRLSFDALQQPLVTSPARARAKAAELPASYAAFDVLAVSGVDLRT